MWRLSQRVDHAPGSNARKVALTKRSAREGSRKCLFIICVSVDTHTHLVSVSHSRFRENLVRWRVYDQLTDDECAGIEAPAVLTSSFDVEYSNCRTPRAPK